MTKQELVEEVKKIPIKSIISSRGVKTRGNDMICPFHEDHHYGSCKIVPEKGDKDGFFKCFACGKHGNSIQFISLYDGISYMDAAYKIAYEHGIISQDDFLNKSFVREVKPLKKIHVEKTADLTAELQDEEIIDAVYKQIASAGLSDSDLEYLKGEERQLTDDEIQLGKYFTIDGEGQVFNTLKPFLKEKGLTKKDLIGIPGFYKEKSKIRFNVQPGIGIPIYNEDNLLLGIQIRLKNVTDKRKRYKWISSAFAYGNNDMSYGCSPETPIAVLIPKEIRRNIILITEGHFKAVKTANTFGCIALAVQGVNNYFGIEFVIDKIRKRYFKNQDTGILIAYDADMVSNKAVFKAASDLGNLLSKDNHVGYMIWNEDNGKGVDDLILNQKTYTSKIVPYEKYCSLYENIWNDVSGDKEKFKELFLKQVGVE